MSYTHTLFLCAGFRTGSTALAAMLEANGVGSGTKERFAPVVRKKETAEQALVRIADDAKGRDVAVVKMMPGHRRAAAAGLGIADTLEGWRARFPNPAFVRVYRRDLLAQAVSLFIAKQTDRWHVYKGEKTDDAEVAFDEKVARHCLRQVTKDHEDWTAFFAGHKPIDAPYSLVRSDPETLVRRILTKAFNGRYLPNRILTAVPNRKQRDARYDQVRKRMKALEASEQTPAQ